MAVDNARYHGLDALRAIAMILGIVVHASLPFFDTRGIWPSDEYESPLIQSIFSFIHLWRMPLFFLISGFFTFVVIKKKGKLYWTKQRTFRLVVPLVIFVPVLALIMPLVWHYGEKGNFDGVGFSSWEFSPYHLWFLVHLLLFIPMVGIGWLFSWVARKLCRGKSLNFSWLVSRVIYTKIPIAFILLLIPILLPSGSELILNPLGSFLFFVFGYGLASRNDFLSNLSKNWPKYTAMAILVFLLHEYWAYSHVYQYEAEYLQNEEGLNGIANLVWYACLKPLSTILFSYALLGFSLDKFNMFNNKWRFLSDASYWIYIAHLPVVTTVSFYLLKFSIPIEIKFIISIIATLALSLITYIYFVRGTVLGLILNGKRRSSSR